ncbi:MAG: cytochrome c peroxidase [Burkholderiaceae bacterium]
MTRIATNGSPGPGRRLHGALSGALSLALVAVLIAGCGGGGSDSEADAQTVASDTASPDTSSPDSSTGSDTAAGTNLSLLATVGDAIFADQSLSASGQMSCETCHDPVRGHAGDGPFGVPAGGPALDTFGFRKSPGIRYLRFAPAFGFVTGRNGDAQQPSGGLFWDGRADSLEAQAGGPFLNPREMANASRAEVVAKLAAAPYATQLLQAGGLTSFADVDAVFDTMTAALAAYQREDAGFASFDSKFDRVMRGEDRFTPSEDRGLRAFRDPVRGNCASCHSLDVPAGADGPLFTDFSHQALGVPRNAAIPDNADPNFFDLGLCGPSRNDLTGRTDLCGRFKTPSLRNVALTAPYFHNGRFETLEEVVRFYALRDIEPQRFYPTDATGQVIVFDDLPAFLRGNVTRQAPFGGRVGNVPRLSEADIVDIVAFLRTLTDTTPAAP